jgi:hypothetical protein
MHLRKEFLAAWEFDVVVQERKIGLKEMNADAGFILLCRFDPRRSVLEWQIVLIDDTNRRSVATFSAWNICALLAPIVAMDVTGHF